MSVHRAYDFRTITGRDWHDAIQRARKTPNKISQIIRDKIKEHGNESIARTSTIGAASNIASSHADL